jgi:hypothetical protein
VRAIRVETSSATILLTEAPEPKVKDRQTGEIAKNAVSGEALMKVGVVYIDEGESSLIAVTVPESGVTDGLAVGAPGVSSGPRRSSLGERLQRAGTTRHRLPGGGRGPGRLPRRTGGGPLRPDQSAAGHRAQHAG